jgi:hypothetical protein
VDSDDSAERCGAAASLAFDLLYWHLDPNEPIPTHEVIFSLAKLMGEGSFQACDLDGIGLDSGYYETAPRVPVAPTSNKFAIHLVDRLEHGGYLIPIMRHFLGRIRRLKDTVIFRGVCHVRLNAKIGISDIGLFLVFLAQTHD